MAEQVVLRIDGQEAAVPGGTTILQAAATVGIAIPRLCYFPGLPATGSCRLCLVEVEGQHDLVPSCTQRVREGMEVRTDTERIRDARRFVLELLWSTHTGDCTTCEKSGACDLQRYTYELGVVKDRFPHDRAVPPTVDTASPLIERDSGLCILCGRCVQACHEQGQGVLDFMRRGMAMAVTTALDRPLHEVGCDFCGSCIAVCPVGALVEKDRKGQGREWELSATETTCGLCSLNCELILDTAGGRIVRARPGSDGYLCAWGKFGWDFLSAEDRLTTPLIRKDGELVVATWEEALDHVAQHLSALHQAGGPAAVGGITGGHLPNETLYLFGKLFRAALGTNNVDSFARLSVGPLASGLQAFGDLRALAGAADVERTEVILAVGPGLEEAYPRARVAVKRALGRGAKLIVVDPADSELGKLAHVQLRPRPGTETLVLDGLIRAIVDQGLHDQGFLARCRGFPAALAAVGAYRADLTGVPGEAVREAARLWAGGKGAIVLRLDGADSALVARTLALLLVTGRTDRALLPLSPRANPWGAVALGALADFLPGLRPIADRGARVELARAWGTQIPEQPGLSTLEMLGKDSPLTGLYIVGADPVASFPNSGRVRKRLSSLKLLVVQDLFLTETARLAHVVLPLPAFPEEEGTFFGPGEEPRRLSRAVPTPIPPSWQAVAMLSSRLGFPMPYRSAEEVEEEYGKLVAIREGGRGVWFPDLPPVAVPTEPLGLAPSFSKFGLPEAAWARRSRLAQLKPEMTR
ncbi:MAG: molybdopterin-dependent oxidoreductase [Candidatus Bipolaricaulota bacterium]